MAPTCADGLVLSTVHPPLVALLMPPRWFGASVGGDMVWSFRPGAESQTPPRTELWHEGLTRQYTCTMA